MRTLYVENWGSCWIAFTFINEVKSSVHEFPIELCERETTKREIMDWAKKNGYTDIYITD